MNRICAYLLLFVVSMTSYGQKADSKSAFLEKWTNSKTYLLAVAERMPAEQFSFKPTEEVMDFTTQLLHIRSNMLWLGTTYFSEETFDRKAVIEFRPDTKEEILKALEEAFDRVYRYVQLTKSESFSDTVDFFAGPKSKLQILNLLQDHVTHHRGQLMIYLRLKGVQPPKYVGW
ncbi:DinB family protein [Aquimarina brevivitae]|uniref:Putative damage-inducible protein DinB n=1 Tax=Aquimarina brevivitae TaxID=323412 RepID=A0A4Q7PFM0_9FLAO|nr:DinB family protein [Aquimarina brevivitae]RZS99135.1 putative damage-inducible protein DinB [Aquimarina brevivitae]